MQPQEVAGIALGPLPDRAAARCRKGPPLGRVCPAVVPDSASGGYLLDSFGRPRGPFQVLELAAGAPRDDFARNRPPGFVHVVLEAGEPDRLIDLAPAPAQPMPLAAALGGARGGPLLVDAGEQGWRRTLVLAAPFPGGGAQGDHLVYRRRSGGLEYRLSLHLWTPLREPVQVLKAMTSTL